MKKVVLLFALAASVSLLGCQSKGVNGMTPEQMAQKIATLEAENALLKQQTGAVNEGSSQGMPNQTQGSESAERASAAHKVFSDIDEDVPTAQMINELAQIGAFDKLSGDKFEPYKPITRGEFLMWLYYAYNKTHKPDKQIRLAPAMQLPFTDITASHPMYKYVQAFASAGFSVGYDAKTFQPDKPLTREEMVGIKCYVDGDCTYQAAGISFNDKDKIDKRFKDAVYSDYEIHAKNGNIIRSFGALKTFKPKEPVLRYEAAACIWQNDPWGSWTAAKAIKGFE